MATDLKTITITRVFDAPLELVWKAWTEPERLMEWWGPKGWTSPSWEIDLRVGGKYLYCHAIARRSEHMGNRNHQKDRSNEGIDLYR
jgi:uncharacterized protein YndB with AHSA1/START domain